MKRDFDLVRKLLLHFEARDSWHLERNPQIEGYDDYVIGYHLRLMYDGGFLRAEVIKSSISDRIIEVQPFELTWKGHEFLDTVRDDAVWSKIRGVIAEKGGSLAFAVIQRLAAQLATTQLLS